MRILLHSKEKKKSDITTRRHIPFLTYRPTTVKHTQSDVCLFHLAIRERERAEKILCVWAVKGHKQGERSLLRRLPVPR